MSEYGQQTDITRIDKSDYHDSTSDYKSPLSFDSFPFGLTSNDNEESSVSIQTSAQSTKSNVPTSFTRSTNSKPDFTKENSNSKHEFNLISQRPGDRDIHNTAFNGHSYIELMKSTDYEDNNLVGSKNQFRSDHPTTPRYTITNDYNYLDVAEKNEVSTLLLQPELDPVKKKKTDSSTVVGKIGQNISSASTHDRRPSIASSSISFKRGSTVKDTSLIKNMDSKNVESMQSDIIDVNLMVHEKQKLKVIPAISVYKANDYRVESGNSYEHLDISNVKRKNVKPTQVHTPLSRKPSQIRQHGYQPHQTLSKNNGFQPDNIIFESDFVPILTEESPGPPHLLGSTRDRIERQQQFPETRIEHSSQQHIHQLPHELSISSDHPIQQNTDAQNHIHIEHRPTREEHIQTQSTHLIFNEDQPNHGNIPHSAHKDKLHHSSHQNNNSKFPTSEHNVQHKIFKNDNFRHPISSNQFRFGNGLISDLRTDHNFPYNQQSLIKQHNIEHPSVTKMELRPHIFQGPVVHPPKMVNTFMSNIQLPGTQHGPLLPGLNFPNHHNTRPQTRLNHILPLNNIGLHQSIINDNAFNSNIELSRADNSLFIRNHRNAPLDLSSHFKAPHDPPQSFSVHHLPPSVRNNFIAPGNGQRLPGPSLGQPIISGVMPADSQKQIRPNRNKRPGARPFRGPGRPRGPGGRGPGIRGPPPGSRGGQFRSNLNRPPRNQIPIADNNIRRQHVRASGLRHPHIQQDPMMTLASENMPINGSIIRSNSIVDKNGNPVNIRSSEMSKFASSLTESTKNEVKGGSNINTNNRLPQAFHKSSSTPNRLDSTTKSSNGILQSIWTSLIGTNSDMDLSKDSRNNAPKPKPRMTQ